MVLHSNKNQISNFILNVITPTDQAITWLKVSVKGVERRSHEV